MQKDLVKENKNNTSERSLLRTWSTVNKEHVPETKGTQTIPLDELDPMGWAKLESEYTDPRKFEDISYRLKELHSTEESNVHKELYGIY